MKLKRRFSNVTPEARLANRIVDLRNALGMRQEDLAMVSRVSRASIALIEMASGNPRVSTLISIAGALGVELEDLFPASDRPCPRAHDD